VPDPNNSDIAKRALIETHLKKPEMYDTEVKDKLFFTGQNAIKGNYSLVSGSAAQAESGSNVIMSLKE